MRVVINIHGMSSEQAWQYKDYNYSCREYDWSKDRYSFCGEGQSCTCTTADAISTNILFIARCITNDTKEKFLDLLEKKLNVAYSAKIPTLTELQELSKEIKKCLIPSLQNLCFIFFQSNKLVNNIEKNPAASCDIQEGYEKFKSMHRTNECW